MQEAEHIPEIDDSYTAVYFLDALEFADASDAFNRYDSPYSLYVYSDELGEELGYFYNDSENES